VTQLVIYPLSLSLVLGSPVSLPCSQPLPPYRVQVVEALTGVPSGLPIDAGRLSYNTLTKTLIVYPVGSGRVFCSGFESGEVKTIESNKEKAK